jgi:hypothetical protein
LARPENIDERDERLRSGPRLREINQELELLASSPVPDEGRFRALAMLVVDAILDGDEYALERAHSGLQALYPQVASLGSETAEFPGRLLGLIDVIDWGLERTLSLAFLVDVEPGSYGHSFLKALAEETGLGNADLGAILDVSDTEVSRVGRRLVTAGCAVKRRLGRRNYWEITPRGLQALDVLEHGGIGRHQRPRHQRA